MVTIALIQFQLLSVCNLVLFVTWIYSAYIILSKTLLINTNGTKKGYTLLKKVKHKHKPKPHKKPGYFDRIKKTRTKSAKK